MPSVYESNRDPRTASPLGTHGRGRQACPSQVRKIGCVVAADLAVAVDMPCDYVLCACAISVYLVHLRLVELCMYGYVYMTHAANAAMPQSSRQITRRTRDPVDDIISARWSVDSPILSTYSHICSSTLIDAWRMFRSVAGSLVYWRGEWVALQVRIEIALPDLPKSDS